MIETFASRKYVPAVKNMNKLQLKGLLSPVQKFKLSDDNFSSPNFKANCVKNLKSLDRDQIKVSNLCKG